MSKIVATLARAWESLDTPEIPQSGDCGYRILTMPDEPKPEAHHRRRLENTSRAGARKRSSTRPTPRLLSPPRATPSAAAFLRSAHPPTSCPTAVPFSLLVTMLATQGDGRPGRPHDPSQGEPHVRSPSRPPFHRPARNAGAKTKGNLSAEENSLPKPNALTNCA